MTYDTADYKKEFIQWNQFGKSATFGCNCGLAPKIGGLWLRRFNYIEIYNIGPSYPVFKAGGLS